MHPRSTIRWILPLCLVLMAEVAHAQGDEGILIDLHRSGARKIRVQLQEMEFLSADAALREGANALSSRLIRDLVYSGVIYLLEHCPRAHGCPAMCPMWKPMRERRPTRWWD